MTRKVVYLLFIIMSFTLVACNNDSEQYKHGYADGWNTAKVTAYAEGYRQGFEQGRPATPSKLSGVTLELYKLLIWSGAAKIIGSLLFAAFSLFRNSDSFTETAGKVTFAVFGTTVTIVLVMYFSISEGVVNVLLSPAPTALSLQLILLAVAGIVMYAFLEVLFNVSTTASHRPKMEAWLLAVIAALVSLLVPVLLVFWERVPEVTGYFGANIFTGSLLGGLFWLGSATLNQRFKSAEVVPKEETVG